MSDPKTGDLRVWWIPQIPGKPFYVYVKTIAEAALILHTLAEYDKFQLDQNIKGDYSNAGGVQIFTGEDDSDDGWVDWEDEDGNDFDAFMEEHPEEGVVVIQPDSKARKYNYYR